LNILPDTIAPYYPIIITGPTFICPGGIDSIMLVASGAPSYTWSNGSTNDTIYVHYAGFYEVYYYETDTNIYGCIASSYSMAYTEVYTDPQPYVTMVPFSGLICPNDSVQLTCDGSVIFEWHGPSGPVGGDTNTIYVNQPGNYYCIRTDSNGCTLISNFVEVVQYNTPYLMVSPSNVVCAGDSVLLTVVTSPTATIQWLPPLNGSSLTMYVDSTGTYSCEVVSCNITTIVSASIIISNPIAEITPNGPLSVCVGDSILLTGNSGMVMYVWNPDSVISQTLWVSQPGEYYLTTYDGYGCHATDSITITQTPAYTVPYLTVAPSAMFCAGDSVLITVNSNSLSLIQWLAPLSGNSFTQYVDTSGIYICNVTYCNIETTDSITVTRFDPLAHITASGPLTFCSGDSVILTANSGMTTYLWNPGNSTAQIITVYQSGTYILRTTDSLGCVATDSVTVLVTPAYTTPWLQASPDTLFCPGDSVLITVNSSTYSIIQWLPPLSGNSFTQEVNNSGTYICTVTYCGITTTDSIIVTQLSATAQITALGPLTFCSGDSVVLTANSGMTSYLWNPGSSINQSLTVFQSGNYVLTTTNLIGCPAYDSVTVFVTPAYSTPWLSVAPDTVFCPGNSVVITVNSSSYSIINWLAPLSGNSFTQTINTPGTYVCTVTYCGIETTDSISISQANPIAQITASGRIPVCSGDTVILNANSGMTTYQWTPGLSNQQSIYVDSANTYSLTTTDNYGCTAIDSITVTVQTDTPPIVTDTTICSGVSITLYVTGNPTIEWYDSINSINPFNSGTNYTTPNLTTSITYYVLMDSGQCKSARVPINVTVEPCDLFVPNVFTPNNDRKNDEWRIEGKALKGIHVKIYDRWGLLIYVIDGLKNGWDGQIMNSNQLAPDGVYYWIADLVDIFDKATQQRGYIELIRN
jgi:gliding motility-associated-like protein